MNQALRFLFSAISNTNLSFAFSKYAPIANAREQDMLSLLVHSYSYKFAASELAITMEALRYHIKNIYVINVM